MQTIHEVEFGTSAYDEMVAFRARHLRHPLGLQMMVDDLHDERLQIHIAGMDGVAVVGTVVLKPVSSAVFKLRQMAVAPEMRGSGLGALLVQYAERVALRRGAAEIELAARRSAQGFYEKLGYKAFGAEFVDVTVPHIMMTKTLR